MWYTEHAYTEGDIDVEDMLASLRASSWVDDVLSMFEAYDTDQEDNVSWWAS